MDPALLNTVFFYAFAALALLGAVLTIVRPNVVHCAVWLIVSLLGVAGLYLLQSAEFLFAAQIILYAGGIMLLFLFVIMLVNLDLAARQRQFSRQWPLALAAVIAIAGAAAIAAHRPSTALDWTAKLAPASASGAGNTEQIAGVLFSRYLVPFELASVLLLAAIAGSVLMTKKRA